MAIGAVEGSLSKLRDITNHLGRSKAANSEDAATPRKPGESTSSSQKDSVLDVLPNPAIEVPRPLGARGRVDSWSLPNAENGMRVTFQVPLETLLLLLLLHCFRGPSLPCLADKSLQDRLLTRKICP